LTTSDDRANRQQFIGLLTDAGAVGIDEHPLLNGFLEGSDDIALIDVTIDSLAVMEVAIAIEECFGVSLAPDIIANYSMLSQLWLAIVGDGSDSENPPIRSFL
jgi:hypothetical protein